MMFFLGNLGGKFADLDIFQLIGQFLYFCWHVFLGWIDFGQEILANLKTEKKYFLLEL